MADGRVRVIGRKSQGHVELEGSPDMVLEVVSRWSVRKDTQVLRRPYWRAGIAEYWLVDARQDPLRFDILSWTERGYMATRSQEGWLKSKVFGRLFKLETKLDRLGHPGFILHAQVAE